MSTACLVCSLGLGACPHSYQCSCIRRLPPASCRGSACTAPNPGRQRGAFPVPEVALAPPPGGAVSLPALAGLEHTPCRTPVHPATCSPCQETPLHPLPTLGSLRDQQQEPEMVCVWACACACLSFLYPWELMKSNPESSAGLAKLEGVHTRTCVHPQHTCARMMAPAFPSPAAAQAQASPWMHAEAAADPGVGWGGLSRKWPTHPQPSP